MKLKQLFDENVVRMALIWVAVICPVAGVVIGAGVGAIRRDLMKGMVAGLALGLGGTLVYVLWIAHNTFIDAVGFDSAPGLLASLCLFAVLGAALGVGGARAAKWLGEKKH